ncbi:vesicular glutamate transporter 1 [Plakobranchus ocellatus]|uniref:Vesicular glutamate transporter 1 n=1 Tax=Plakobranchus ocellatus TaxID=259542 RepID=A0AAV4AJ56_9GAST|nr:vesicular glutamate transporter 1 [Plakobranchus ocellatus]
MVNQTAIASHYGLTISNHTVNGLLSSPTAEWNVSNHTNVVEYRIKVREEISSEEDGEMVWDKHTQGLIHGSLYWGYALTNVAGGVLADRYGGKHVIGLSLLSATLLTLLVPVIARWNVIGLIVLRFLTGFSQGFVSPAMQSLWSHWAPPLESSRLRSICFAGSQMGKVLTYPLTALLCEYGFDGGWPSVFYVQARWGKGRLTLAPPHSKLPIHIEGTEHTTASSDTYRLTLKAPTTPPHHPTSTN